MITYVYGKIYNMYYIYLSTTHINYVVAALFCGGRWGLLWGGGDVGVANVSLL